MISANSADVFFFSFSKYTDPSASHFAIRGKHFGPIRFPCFPAFNLPRVLRHLQTEVGGYWAVKASSEVSEAPASVEETCCRVRADTEESFGTTAAEIFDDVVDNDVSNYAYHDCNQSYTAAKIQELSKAANRPGMLMTLLIMGYMRQFICAVPGH